MASEGAGSPIDRREALRRAVWLVGGAAAVGALAACGGEQRSASESGPAIAAGPARRYFTQDRLALLQAVAATMIPATDTPGAIEAGVPEFVDDMMADWASAATREKTDTLLDAIDAAAIMDFGAPFTGLPPNRRTEALTAFDATRLGGGDIDYQAFKELLLLGYYHSEIGATQELQYELVPGAWIACAPLSEVGRAWAD